MINDENGYTPVDWGDRLPDGSIINAEISVVQYLAAETGIIVWNVFFDGDITLSTALGLLDLAKLDMINRTPNVLGPGSISSNGDDET
jgi:hypothetical protein